MGKIFKTFIFGILFSLIGSLAPKSVSAFEVISWVVDEDNPYTHIDRDFAFPSDGWNFWDAFTCLITLPVCALDDSAKVGKSSTITITRGKLQEKDYSDETIDLILANQTELSRILKKDGKKMVFADNESEASIREGLQKLGDGHDTKFSETYLKFLNENRF